MNPLIIAILTLVAVLLVLLFFYCALKTRHRHLRYYTVTRHHILINHDSPDADKARAELLDALNSTPACLDK